MKSEGTKPSGKSEVVRRHFAETAKAMILAAGIESVSARNLAQKAGYALGTIYNHFNSLDEIFWYARSLMIADIGAYMMSDHKKLENKDDLKALFKRYMDYFIVNPNIYRFLYFHHLDNNEKTVDSVADSPEMARQTEEAFSFLMESGKYAQNDISTVIKTLIFSTQGLLTMLITDNDNLDVHAAYKNLGEIIDFIIKDC